MEPEINEWTEALAGRRRLTDAREQAAVDALRRATIAPAESPDEIGLQRLLTRLRQEGLLQAGPTKAAPSQRRRFGAMAASFVAVIALAVLVQINRPTDSTVPPDITDIEKPRGVAGAVRITSANVEESATAIERSLVGLNLTPHRLPRQNRIVVEVEVNEASLPRFREWAATINLQAEQPGLYRIIFSPPASGDSGH